MKKPVRDSKELLFENMMKLNPTFNKQLQDKKKSIAEAKIIKMNEGINDEIYFQTLSEALDSARRKAEKKGYTVNEDDMFTHFGTGGISYGETKRANIGLLVDGIPQPRRNLTIAIYRMDSGTYELTSYIN
jgi:hypothetical protein